jgi:cobalt-zinc-cadmium resistance protein CzcA
VQTAVGANAVTQVQQGEARFDVTLRYQQQYRDTREAIENIRLLRLPASAFRWRS